MDDEEDKWRSLSSLESMYERMHDKLLMEMEKKVSNPSWKFDPSNSFHKTMVRELMWKYVEEEEYLKASEMQKLLKQTEDYGH